VGGFSRFEGIVMRSEVLVRRTLRVPRVQGPAGDGSTVVRQLDAVLTGVGFVASRELLAHLDGLAPGAALDLAVDVVGAVRELVGDHVRHNAYFVDFPRNVPDTWDFWLSCLRETVAAHGAEVPPGIVNLLSLAGYGRYRHSYVELLAAHDELIASLKDRVTVLHLGGTLAEETTRLYTELAGSATPLTAADLELLAELAAACPGHQVAIPVRENRAVVNAVRLAHGLPLVAVDTVVDVLRVACRASGGDVTLATPTRFRSFRRSERRVLLGALDAVVAGGEGKLGDVARHAEVWKRLAAGLHPYEDDRFARAREVFDVARGDRVVRSLAGRAESAFRAGRVADAAAILATAPGMLVRSLDRLLRTTTDTGAVLTAFESVAGGVSGRVLCSLREHVANRSTVDRARVFTGRAKRAWRTVDARLPLPFDVIDHVRGIVDTELAARLSGFGPVVVDPAVLTVAVPLSGKAAEDGFAVLPRGSRSVVDGEVLRFFAYWRETARRTDYDLSALLLDDDFAYRGHVSWTNLRDGEVVYSGDLTEARNGATEFIDVPLDKVGATRIVPQVNVYAGEGFDTVAESMFGWMVRDRAQKGAPFEARTVRTRSDLRGSGRVALPAVFSQDAAGTWSVLWTHLYLTGSPTFNQVEGNHLTTGSLARAVVERRYLMVGDLLGLLPGPVTTWTPDLALTGPVTYVGLTRPDGLPAGSRVLDLGTLNQLVPA
jgi:hypothetical protein